ncbi:MAG: class IV adenylate cyclase [Gemmatimonadota bacterium]
MIDPALDARSGTNLELKASVHDLGETRERVRIAGARLQGTERQVDRYFQVSGGHVKLRQSSLDGAHLVVYRRPEAGVVREARFHRLPVSDPDGLAGTLTALLGAGATVEKAREVWWWEDVRIHLDQVDGLGSFVEFEARMDRIGDRTEADRRIASLRERLGIESEDVVNRSYEEMIDDR